MPEDRDVVRRHGPLDDVTRRASGLVTQVVGVAGLVNRAGWGLTRRLPGGASVERVVRPVERAVAGEVRRRLHEAGLLEPDGTGARVVRGTVGEHQVTAVVRPLDEEVEPLRAAMSELLSRSVEQTREQSEQQLFAVILRQLVPDEARMLAALSDGSAFPLIHVAARGPLGGIKRLVLENASTVGRAAGTQLSRNTPTYVTHLLQLGLVDVDPEDRTLLTQYEILQTDELVRAAEAEARLDGRGGARIIRQTIRMSEFGRRFWDACHPARRSLPQSWGRRI
ncbi:MAG TPA: Abi-alpha family protein [Pseudonocardiaceae bacterium]